MLDNWLKIAVPFIAGLETKSATATVTADKLAVLENGVFTKHGSVAKRYGYSAIADYTVTGTLDGERRAVVDGNGSPTLVTSRRLNGLVDGHWSSRGRYAAVTYRAEEVAHANRNQSAADSATANGVTAVVWKYATNSIYFQLFNDVGTPLCAVTALATATADYPSAVAAGDNLLLFYVDTSTNNLMCRVIRTADVTGSVNTATTATTLSDLTADRLYGVCEGVDGTVLLAWEGDGSATVTGIGVAHVSAFGVSSSPTTVSADATSLAPPAVAYNSITNSVCVAWPSSTGGTVEFRVMSYSTFSGGAETSTGIAASARLAVAPLVDDASIAADDDFVIAMETIGASDDLDTVTLVPVTTLSATVIRHSHLASRGMVLAEQGCFVLGHESRTNLQNAYYLYSHDGICLGAFEQATAVDRSSSPELPGLSGGCIVLGFQRGLDADDFKSQYTHTGIRLLRFDDSGLVSAARLGQTTYLSGCQLWAYDGNQPVEAGFHMFPDVAVGGTCAPAADLGTAGDFTQLAAGANLATATQYNYRFYYEWYNARGERCRSLPMQRSVTTSIASCEMKIRIPTLRHTVKSATHGRQAEVSIVVYRTQGNLSNVFFRVSSPDPTATGDNGYIANSFSVDYVDFIDDLADTAIVDNERDMFSLSELLAAPVPGPEVLYATQDRLYLAGGSIPRGSVQPSKQHTPGLMAEIAPELEARPCTDDVVAMGSVNEVVVAFTAREAHALSGPGFDNTGGGQPFGTGRVTSDVGCTDPGSVVMVPGGLLFKSSKGIYSMDQSFNVEYLGAPVERFNAQAVTAAHVVPDTNHVVFLCSSGESLMFDYFYGQWGSFTQHLGASAAVVGSDYYYLRNDGVVYKRAPGTYTDAGAPVILKIRTGRFRLDELQGQFLLRRFGILGEYKSPHSLKVRLFYDRNAYPTSEVTIDVTGTLNQTTWGSGSTWGSDDFWGGSGGISDYRFVRRPRRPKCAQIAFEFEDVITEEAGASFELTELLLEVQPMDGIQNTSARRKV